MALQTGNDTTEQLPLRGVTLCSTAVPQHIRATLAATAQELGAVFSLDLTTHVTHLIVGDIVTQKYRYVAKERPDIKVVSTDWLEAVREAFRDGDDVDMDDMDEKYKLGAFHGLKICVTGFDDLTRRTFISDTVVQQGAEYHGDLTRTVTHLIANAPTGSKYKHGKLWRIQVVSFKWFEDSLARGMALDESLYDPEMPEEQQGEGAVSTRRVNLGKRTREAESQATSETGSRKLRRTTSTRLHSQSQDMWQDLTAREDAPRPDVPDQWKEDSEMKEAPPRRSSQERIQVRQSDAFSTEPQPAPVPTGIFSGCYVLVIGFQRGRKDRLLAFLEPRGAIIANSVAGLEFARKEPGFVTGYVLMPHTWLDASPMEQPEVAEGIKLVTEWWVERCIHYKQLIDPADDVLSRPLWDVKSAEFADLSICTTGFTGIEFRHIAETIKLMGATYAENLVPTVSVLISGSKSVRKEKAYYVAKYNISVVSAAWLLGCLEEGRKLDHAEFAMELPVVDTKEGISDRSSASPASSEVRQSKSARAVKKSDGAPKRLSNTRHRPATPSLSLQPTAPATSRPPRNAGPFVHEDDDEDDDATATVEETMADAAPVPVLEPTRAQPLQEISPNASPRRSGPVQEKTDDNLKSNTVFPSSGPKVVPLPVSPASPRSRPAQEPEAPPPPRPAPDLQADIAALLQNSRSQSNEPPVQQRRKNRPLGRSASGIGSRVVSASSISDHADSPGVRQDSTDSAADGFASYTREAVPPPSTQLGYETADAEAHRQMMERRMKVSLQDESTGKRVASVGTVKDSFVAGGGDGGVGNRVRGRNRNKM
ncbi:protein kinase activating protein dpb11 [Elasticomyces elasticus]|nr:protein kinase activating protein dpb11 [Elasticomyces elasticus]